MENTLKEVWHYSLCVLNRSLRMLYTSFVIFVSILGNLKMILEFPPNKIPFLQRHLCVSGMQQVVAALPAGLMAINPADIFTVFGHVQGSQSVLPLAKPYLLCACITHRWVKQAHEQWFGYEIPFYLEWPKISKNDRIRHLWMTTRNVEREWEREALGLKSTCNQKITSLCLLF